MAVTMAWLRINRAAAVVFLLCGALALPCLATAARAEDDSAPTYEQCEAMPQGTELEKLEALRCQMLYSIYQTAFRAGKQNLRRWKAPMRIYATSGDNEIVNIIDKYAFLLNEDGVVSLRTANGKYDANVFILVAGDRSELDGAEIRSVLDAFFNARSRDTIVEDLRRSTGDASVRPFSDTNGEMRSCVIYVNKYSRHIEKSIGMSLSLCTVAAHRKPRYISIFSDSALYKDINWFDRQMITIIYYWLEPGMTWAEAKPIINRLFDDNRQKAIREGLR